MTRPRLQLILSPAKTMDMSPCAAADAAGATEAVGLARADALAALLAKKTKGQLKALLGVSDALAAENHARYAAWAASEPRQACVAYDGMAYAKLDARTLGADALRVAQRRLLILSGLWGPVRPLDRIKAYRLEMACKKLPGAHADLPGYWRETATAALLAGYADDGDRVLVNAASDESARRRFFFFLIRREQRPVSEQVRQGDRLRRGPRGRRPRRRRRLRPGRQARGERPPQARARARVQVRVRARLRHARRAPVVRPGGLRVRRGRVVRGPRRLRARGAAGQEARRQEAQDRLVGGLG